MSLARSGSNSNRTSTRITRSANRPRIREKKDMTTEKPSVSEGATTEQPNLAEQATESMLGPNPFIGLRLEDIFARFKAIGRQAGQKPKLLVENEAALMPRFVYWMA